MSEIRDRERQQRLRAIISDCLRRRSLGESISYEGILLDHADLAPDLSNCLRYFDLLAAISEDQPASSGSSSAESREELKITSAAGGQAARQLLTKCPTCHASVPVAIDDAADERVCPACGSSFRLFGDGDAAESASATIQQIGRFELLQFLGKGGFGAVWKARDPDLDRIVAVKVPRWGELSADEAELFLREARASAQIRHPNIVGIHEVGRDGDRIYLVCDYIEGVSLTQWATNRRPTFDDIATLCERVARSLHYVHERGIVHRDLKPSNVLVGKSDEPYLLDFGLAKRTSGELTMTLAGQVMGTPAYMSPEQASGGGHESDARSDVYALGVILFELLTGEVPFQGSPHRILHQVIHDEPPRPRKYNPSIPVDLATICLKCLEKGPSRRYASAHALAQDLGRYRDRQPIAARRNSWPRRAARWCRRRPALGAGIGVLVMAAIVGPLLTTAFTSVRAREQAARLEVNRAAARTRFANAIAFVLSEVLPESGDSHSSDVADVVTQRISRLQSRLELGLLAQASDLEAEVLEVVSLFARTHHLAWPAEWSARQALLENLGKDDQQAADQSRYCLAEALLMRRRYIEAENACRQTLAERIDRYGPEHLEVMRARNLLARILDACGQFADAEGQARMAIQWHVDNNTEPNVDAANGRYILAQIRIHQEDWPAALRECCLALKARWRFYSDDHADVIASLRQLDHIVPNIKTPSPLPARRDSPPKTGERGQANGDPTNQFVEGLMGDASPFRRFLPLADTLTQQKQANSDSVLAVEALEQIIELKIALLGKDDREIGETLADLGSACFRAHDWRRADMYLTRAVSILEHQLGANHVSVGTAYEFIANARAALCDWPRAVDAARRVCDVWRRQPPRQRDTLLMADAQRELGRLLTFAGRLDEAETTLVESIETLKSFADGQHHTLALAMSDYAWLLRRQGRNKDALRNASKAFQLGRRLPATPPDQLTRERTVYGVTLVDNHQFDRAKTMLQESIPETVGSFYRGESIRSLVQACEELGDAKSAEKWRAELRRLEPRDR